MPSFITLKSYILGATSSGSNTSGLIHDVGVLTRTATPAIPAGVDNDGFKSGVSVVPQNSDDSSIGSSSRDVCHLLDPDLLVYLSSSLIALKFSLVLGYFSGKCCPSFFLTEILWKTPPILDELHVINCSCCFQVLLDLKIFCPEF